MKKIIGILTGTALAAGLFAVDFSATIKAKGSVSGGSFSNESIDFSSGDDSWSGTQTTTTAPSFYAPFFANNDLKDNDMLEVHFSGDKAGADFKFYVGAIADNTEIKSRSMDIWFQPIDQLKVTLGNVGLSLYTERLNWYKVPTGRNADVYISWDGGLNNTVSSTLLYEDLGVKGELNIGALYIGAGVSTDKFWSASTGTKTESSYTDNDGTTTKTTEGTASASYGHWGVVAKYDLTGLVGLPVSVGAGFRDDGFAETKLLRFGADFGNWSSPYYCFIQPMIRFEIGDNWNGSGFEHTVVTASKDTPATWNGEYHIAAFVFDNYLSYNFGFMKAELTAPVTIRLYDPSYWTLRAKVSIPLNAFTLYVVAGNPQGFNVTGGTQKLWYLDKRRESKTVAVETTNAIFTDAARWDYGAYLNVGVTFNVGAMAFDVGIEGEVIGDVYNYSHDGKTMNDVTTSVAWAIPFVATIAF